MEANQEMIDGYLDGIKDDREILPAGLSNRSKSYQHGWQNGRDDRAGKPRASAQELREIADNVTILDSWPSTGFVAHG